MATTGDRVTIDMQGLEDVLIKLANMKNIKKQKQFLYRLLGTSSTPLVKAYKKSLPKMYPAETKNQTFDKTGPVQRGSLIESIEKIRSKGNVPAIYIGPRTARMRKGQKGNLDGFYIQFLKFGGRFYSGDPTLLSELNGMHGPTKLRIGKGLRDRILIEWDK